MSKKYTTQQQINDLINQIQIDLKKSMKKLQGKVFLSGYMLGKSNYQQ